MLVKRKITLIATVPILLLLGCGMFVYSAAEPDTPLGFGIFRAIYALPIPKEWFLQVFSEGLHRNNGGYVGQPVDEFLCSRIESTSSDAERIAIAEFYISQAGGREGDCIAKISDGSKEKVLVLIFDRLDSYESYRAHEALLIIDWLRRGSVICKAHIQSRSVPGSEWNQWWQANGVFEAKTKYRSWWDKDLAWYEKKQINPLAETNMIIGGGCG